MKFAMRANIEFQADDLDGAFLKLSEHFGKLKKGLDTDLINIGAIHIIPIMPKE